MDRNTSESTIHGDDRTPSASLSPARIRAVMTLLLAIYTLSFLDRQIVNILAEPIARDLNLSDAQIGMMAGLAFAVFYTVLGVAIARYADRPKSNRGAIVSVALALWSVMTAVSGVAQNFAQMFLARVGVGIGEAGCSPAAISLIADIAPAEKRASAVAFYGLGIPIGSILGMLVGGVLSDLYGWRISFVVVGLPGLVLALIVWRALPEPRRMQQSGVRPEQTTERAGLVATLRDIMRSKAFVRLAIAASFVAFVGYGASIWTAIFFIRVYNLSPGTVGLWWGLVLGVGGAIGVYLGGAIADRYGKRDRRVYLAVPALAIAACVPLQVAAYASGNWIVTLIFLCGPVVAQNMYFGPTFACIQGLVVPSQRATAVSVIMFLQNLIGLGLGPLLFGLASDTIKQSAEVDSVRFVLIGAAFLGLAPAYFFWSASQHLAHRQPFGNARA